jgi:hypothetical protein
MTTRRDGSEFQELKRRYGFLARTYANIRDGSGPTGGTVVLRQNDDGSFEATGRNPDASVEWKSEIHMSLKPVNTGRGRYIYVAQGAVDYGEQEIQYVPNSDILHVRGINKSSGAKIEFLHTWKPLDGALKLASESGQRSDVAALPHDPDTAANPVPKQIWIPALSFATACLLFLFLAFFLRDLSHDQRQILNAIFCLLAGCATFFLGGTAFIRLTGDLVGVKFLFSGTAGVAVLVLVLFHPIFSDQADGGPGHQQPSGGVTHNGDIPGTPGSEPDWPAVWQQVRTSEPAAAHEGEVAFNFGRYDWAIRFLEQAKAIQTAGVWKGNYPFLAGSYFLSGKADQGRSALADVLADVRRRTGYLSHPAPLGMLITNLGKVREKLSPDQQREFDAVIDEVTRIKQEVNN